MTTRRSLAFVSVLVLVVIGMAPARAEAKTKCDLTFTIKEWAAIYKHAKGSGTITCSNGQRARVAITSTGGGLTAGKFKIEGHGEFSEVDDVRDVFGAYASAEANAGVVKSGAATVVTKGDITLGLSGKGEGWDVGVSFGKFTITHIK
ncbi:MAG TPA: hypothetical protein VN999_14110 [Thermoanaerobaculia bacterium]|nr:hypothetical protein [Thermoanaerobaculia bacterium]